MSRIRVADVDHDAVLASEAKHLLVTAPPGSGKTYLCIQLADQLAPALDAHERILLLTFSNQARTQLEREAVSGLRPESRPKVEITNYHRFFWSTVWGYRRALGLPLETDIGSRTRRVAALTAVVEDAKRLPVGLAESLAEHEFPEFRDSRTVSVKELDSLLAVVHREFAGGRLVFDDLGALFWTALKSYPVLATSLQARYPVVIADEHQDASAVQDAVVRLLATRRLIVFADRMQLIHEFRGASDERLSQHERDCDERRSLGTGHRWRDNESLGAWLAGLRRRLEGGATTIRMPPAVRVRAYTAKYGFSGLKPPVLWAISEAFSRHARTVAVLVRRNEQASDLQRYLLTEGQHPRQISTEDFEDARADVEGLPSLSAVATAARVLTRLGALVPALESARIQQANKRLEPHGVRLQGASPFVQGILSAVKPIYTTGPERYFECLAGALGLCVENGYDVPRQEMMRTIRKTAATLKGTSYTLEAAIRQHAQDAVESAHVAPRLDRGLFVMTAHQAKGKEFDAVILADFSERDWKDTTEGQRLFYVVATRATKTITIITPDQGQSKLMRFLA